MANLERALLIILLVVPLVLEMSVAGWVLLPVGIVSAGLAIIAGRWVLWPIAGLALVEAIVLFTVSVDLSVSVAVAHVLLVALAWWPVWVLPIPHWPEPDGQFGVGYRELDLGDEPEMRLGRVYLWYPTDSKSIAGRRLQRTVEVGALREVQTYLGKHPRLQAHMQYGQTYSEINAPLAEGLFPLVVFNHGGAMWPNQNFSLMEKLAAEGLVVAAIGHPGDSAGLVYEDGFVQGLSPERVAELRGSEGGMLAYAEYLLSTSLEEQKEKLIDVASGQESVRIVCERWARQTLKAIDGLQTSSVLQAQIDFEKITYVGMSMGGAVAYRCCQMDKRAVAGVNLDGMIWDFDHQNEPLQVPFLMCYGDLASLRSSVVQQMNWDADPAAGLPFNSCYLGGAEVLTRSVEYLGSTHMNFTDFSWAARGNAKGQFGLGKCNPQIMIEELNKLVTGFVTDSLGVTNGSADGYLQGHQNWREVI